MTIKATIVQALGAETFVPALIIHGEPVRITTEEAQALADDIPKLLSLIGRHNDTVTCAKCDGWGFTTTNPEGQAKSDECENTECQACNGTGSVKEEDNLTPAERSAWGRAIEQGVD